MQVFEGLPRRELGGGAVGSKTLRPQRRRAIDYRLLAGILFATWWAASSAPARAQSVRGGADNVRAMQEMQQLAAERTALKADNAKLKDEVAELQKKLDKANADSTSVSARTRQLEVASAREAESGKQTADALGKSRAQMQELIGHYRETAQQLKGVETDRNLLRGQLETRTRDYDVCVEHNVGLYDVGREALDRLDQHGFWSKVGESEPFTQLARARLDNLIDDYRQRLQELRVDQSGKEPKNNVPAKSP
jgi:cell division protein FtsB